MIEIKAVLILGGALFRNTVRDWYGLSLLWEFSRNNNCSQGEQGWRSCESTSLLPMWPGFESRRQRHMWVEFVVGSLLCSDRFFSGYSSGFPLSSKTNTSKFQFDLECTDTFKRVHMNSSGCASWINKQFNNF